MDWTLEVVVLPVSDLDQSIAFYRDQVGFELDHDTVNEHMHVAQLTARGSGCSIVMGDLPSQNEMAPGSMRGLQLCVADAAAARAELVSRGSRRASRSRSAIRTGARSSGSPIPMATPGPYRSCACAGRSPSSHRRPGAGSAPEQHRLRNRKGRVSEC